MGIVTGEGAFVSGAAEVSPQAKVAYRFVPLEHFEATVGGRLSVYLKGFKYTVHEGNTDLRRQAEDWILNSKVKRIT